MMNWHDVEAWATERLSTARNRNDGDLDLIETAKLRGRIALLKELIALPEQKKVLEAQSKSALLG